MSEVARTDLLKLLALLEQRHGVGVRSDELPRWLEERLKNAVAALLVTRGGDVAALLDAVVVQPELSAELANALRVGETRFYRDAAQWEGLRLGVIPGVVARRDQSQSLVALSAGCSTGEEAWTLAMLLYERLPKDGSARPRLRVVGVDRSEPALVTARAATYHVGSELSLPRELRQRFLAAGVDGGVRVVAELTPLVTFQCRDLASGVPPGRYALIICKNVLIYFGDEARARLVDGLRRSLTEDGVLLVARSEVPIVRALGAEPTEIAPGITAFRG